MRIEWLPAMMRLKLRTLFRGTQVDHELDEEIRYHIERKTDLLISQGLSPSDARFAALRAFGGVEQRKEDCRDARGPWASVWLERLAQDVRHGARLLAKNPGFGLVAALSMAIGVGANTAMFSVADGLIFRPLAIPDADELVVVSGRSQARGGDLADEDELSYPDYRDLRDGARSFAGLAAEDGIVASFARQRDELAQGKFGFAVSGNFFDVVRVQPALGRAFVPEEDRVVGRDAVVVLAHETWTQQFGGDPSVIGTQIRLGGTAFTVIGVMPEGFTGLDIYQPPAFYVPVAMMPTLEAGAQTDVLERRDARTFRVIGRLKPGVSLPQANQESELIAAALEQAYPDSNRQYMLRVRTEREARFDEFFPAFSFGVMLIALALAVLLVACANIAGLLASRAPARAREIAVRLAIGGSRARLVRQLITESIVIAAAGGVMGVLIGYAGIQSFQQFQLVNDLSVRLTYELDRRALVVGFAVAGLSAILSSLVPAWRSTRADLSSTLRNASSSPGRASRLFGRHGLVASQIALTLVLLTVALSFYRAFEAEYGRGPGFRTDHLLLANLDTRLAGYDASRTDDFYRRLDERVSTIPGVVSAASSTFVPLSMGGANSATIVPDGYQLPQGIDSLEVMGARVDEDYFETIGIPIVSGRGFTRTDDADSPRVAIVSQGMSARYWPNESPLGKRIQLTASHEWVEVIGVAADIKFFLFTPRSAPLLYLPRLQHPSGRSTLLVRTTGEAASVAAFVRAAIHDLDRDMPILAMQTMADFYHAAAKNLNTVVVRTVAAMGIMGLVLALVGLYGLMAYSVGRRTREIGVRMAMGAMPASVLRMVLRQGSLPWAAGVTLGVLASVAVGGVIRGVIPGTGADAVTFLLIVPAVIGVAVLATYIPARRASRVDPLAALRQE